MCIGDACPLPFNYDWRQQLVNRDIPKTAGLTKKDVLTVYRTDPIYASKQPYHDKFVLNMPIPPPPKPEDGTAKKKVHVSMFGMMLHTMLSNEFLWL